MAEYKGSVELISGITPKNGGDFPLVDAKDVLMPDGKRLDKWNGGSAECVGKATEQGGVIFNDHETNQATAPFATSFGTENKAAGECSIVGGRRIYKSGAEELYFTGENGSKIYYADPDGEYAKANQDGWVDIQAYEGEQDMLIMTGDGRFCLLEDVRYNEAYGTGAVAIGKGAVAYSRASKSFGYRTQTGYPPSAEIAVLRPEAFVKTDENGNPEYPADNVGQAAFAIGADTAALENHALAGGWGSIARGANSFSFGDHNETIGYASFSSGINNKSYGAYSVSFGNGNEACAANSFVTGNSSKAYGANGIAMGFTCVAYGDGSIALGSKNTSGDPNKTTTKFAVTAGRECIASATCAVALGYGTIANAYGQTVVGRFNKADAKALFAVGSGTEDSKRATAFQVNTDGSASVAGKLSFGSIDNTSREKIMSPMRSQEEPSGKGDYIGQICLVESYSEENFGWYVTEVYMYCGTNPLGDECWIKIS